MQKYFKKFSDFLLGYTAIFFMSAIKILPFSLVLKIVGEITPLLGRFSSRHKIILENLQYAYPEKSFDAIKEIALKSWRHVGYLFVEYFFIDKIFTTELNSQKLNRIKIVGTEHLQPILTSSKPHIFFTAHMANFEILPICAACYGIKISPLFRPPNNPYLAKKILKLRRLYAGQLISSRDNAARTLFRLLQQKNNIGLLVDQKFHQGIDTTFFNRPTKTNPLLGRLANKVPCEIYPAWCMRLDNGQYQITIESPITLPIDLNNRVDLEKTAQYLNDIVETWIRQAPEQWMWFHKRWQLH